MLWVADLKAIEGDGGDADRRHEHVGAGAHRNKLAHEPSESPDGHEDLHEVERLREETEGEVGDGQVDDEYVARRSHCRVPRDDEADETVAGRSEYDKQREQSY